MQAKEIEFSSQAKSLFVCGFIVGTALPGDCRLGESVEYPRHRNQHNEANRIEVWIVPVCRETEFAFLDASSRIVNTNASIPIESGDLVSFITDVRLP